jgi:tRNA (guanine-N7-)-methyltransferase
VSLTVRPFQSDALTAPANLKDFQWPPLFQRQDRPLDLEIGCGVGWHPIRYAKENPERNLIAIEHTREKFEKFAGRARNTPLENLLPVHADAVRWVAHALQPRALDRVLLLYPNPEPKAANKRWLRMPFMHHLLETMKPGAELILATNIEDYWREAQTYAREFWNLEIVEARRFSSADAPMGTPRTHFEKKYLARGETCFDLKLKKARG